MFNRSWFPGQSQQDLRISGDKKDIFGNVITVESSNRQFRDDPDRIDTNEILCKLDQYQKKSYLPVISTRCECFKRDWHNTQSLRREETLKEILKIDSATSSSSSSEEEEEDDLTLQYVLDKLDVQRRKLTVKSQQKALVTLIKSYKGQETLQQECIDKLIAYLHTENLVLKEAGLVLLHQCCSHADNVRLLIKHEILNDLELIITSSLCRPVHQIALDVWGKIIEYKTLSDKWWEPIKILLPKLFTRLTKEKQVDIKVSILKIFRTLSSDKEGASLLSSQGIPTLLSIKDKNSDVKECCAEIFTGLVCHGDPVNIGNLDNNGITISANLLKEGPCGPQLQSLKLLSSICETSSGHADIVNNNIIPLVLSSMRDSNCRKVRSEAAGVLGCILTTRKPGKIKDILNQLSEYFDLCNGETTKDRFTHGGYSKLQTVYPVKLKKEKPVSLDRALEKLIKIAVDLMCKEGEIGRNGFGQPVSIGLNPTLDKGPTRLQTIINTISVFQTVSCMPWAKYPNSLSTNISTLGPDVNALVDSKTVRLMLSHVKPQLSQTVWEGAGMCLIDLLTVYSRVFRAKNSQFITRETVSLITSGDKIAKQGLYLSEVFDEKAATLIMSLLNILLTFAVCSCGAVENPGENKLESFKYENSSQNLGDKKIGVKKRSRPTSAKANLMQTEIPKQVLTDIGPQLSADTDQPTSAHVTSDENGVDLSVKSSQQGQATDSNPSTPLRSKSGVSAKTAHKISGLRPYSAKAMSSVNKNYPEAQSQKETEALRRLMRKSLFEAGIFEAITPFLLCSDVSYKVLSSQILRCLIQPLEEKILKLTSNKPSIKTLTDSKAGKTVQRPMSAVTTQERNAKVYAALNKMSPSVAHVIAQAMEKDTPLQLVPKTSTGALIGKHQLWVTPEPQSQIQDLNVNVVMDRDLKKPKIDVMSPIAVQCRQSLLNSIGPDLFTGLFSSCREVKKHTLLLLEDIVQNGDVTLHMKMSEYGCMPKLIDFLRVNEDDELMEITALIVTRILVASDIRLKQLFDKHGGSNLLMAMSRYTKGLLKEEVTLTLRTVNKVSGPRNRPQSAPARTQRDIWENISQRWKQEDKVSEILQQWNK